MPKYCILKRDALAFIDSFAGLVPCKVLRIKHNDIHKCGTFAQQSDITVTVRITATRGAYRLGEVLTLPSHNVVPRGSVYTRNGQYRVAVYSVHVGAPFDVGQRVQTPDGPGVVRVHTETAFISPDEPNRQYPRSGVLLDSMQAAIVDTETRYYFWHELSEATR